MNKIFVVLALSSFSSLSVAYRGAGPGGSDHTPFFAFLGLLAVVGLVQFFEKNKDIGAFLGGLSIMAVISIVIATVGSELGLYSSGSILLVAFSVFVVWLFYPYFKRN